MATREFYRGGTSLVPKRRELHFDPATGDVLPERGVSVSSSPDGLDQFGGAHRILRVPSELQIVKRGKRPDHYEIVPVQSMPYGDYLDALRRIQLAPV
jgi:hypothetical protein